MKFNEFEIIYLEELESSNNYAKKYIDDNFEQKNCNKVIHTNFQTKGRGAFENSWYSSRDLNLLFSVIICPKIKAKDQFFISKITSLAIIDYLKRKGVNAKIKWPNDILVDNKKISGILIENSIISDKISNSIVGIGINLNEVLFPDEINACSLKLIKNINFDINTELVLFLSSYSKFLNLCKYDNFYSIDDQYFSRLIGINEFLRYKKDNEIFEAKVIDIDEFGRLVLENLVGEKQVFGFKEVELIIN